MKRKTRFSDDEERRMNNRGKLEKIKNKSRKDI